MTSPTRPLRDRIRARIGLVPLSGDPQPHPKPTPTTLLVPEMPATMKTPKTSPIKTHGTGLEPMSVYGAVPLSPERIRRVQAEAKAEKLAHEKEITAPIQLHNKGAGSPPMNGYWGTDPSINKSVAEWEAQQRVLFAHQADQVDAILPNARNQPPPPIKSGHAL